MDVGIIGGDAEAVKPVHIKNVAEAFRPPRNGTDL